MLSSPGQKKKVYTFHLVWCTSRKKCTPLEPNRHFLHQKKACKLFFFGLLLFFCRNVEKKVYTFECLHVLPASKKNTLRVCICVVKICRKLEKVEVSAFHTHGEAPVEGARLHHRMASLWSRVFCSCSQCDLRPCKSTQTGKKKISASMWNNMHTSNGYKKSMYAQLASPLNWNWSGCVESNSTHNCTYIWKPIELFYFSRFTIFKNITLHVFLVLT